MSAKVFLDTNIFVYSFSGSDLLKRERAIDLYEQYVCYSSIQALNEFCNVCIKKLKRPRVEIEASIVELMDVCHIGMISTYTLFQALRLQSRYEFSYFDSLMLASALEYGCECFMSEDLSSGQVIDNKLKIVNPFENI